MNKRKFRDSLRLTGSLLFCWLNIPHLIVYWGMRKKRVLINSDIKRLKRQVNIPLSDGMTMLYFLHNNSYYRSLFYHRIGPELSLLIGWWRPRNRTFIIPDSTKVGGGISFVHPYSTVLNAQCIGENFSCLHSVTLGKKNGKRPIIGDNVSVGCHACIIGGVHIGDNVTIGAGSVVVKDVPDNAVVVGNPAIILKLKSEE